MSAPLAALFVGFLNKENGESGEDGKEVIDAQFQRRDAEGAVEALLSLGCLSESPAFFSLWTFIQEQRIPKL